MRKLLLHFGSNQLEKGTYNIIVKVTDITSLKELENVLIYLGQKGFEILSANCNRVEAKFSHNNFICWVLVP